MAQELAVEQGRIMFAAPLIPGVVVARPNRFIISARLGSGTHRCHCPCTGPIGGLTLDGLPCLLSGPHDGKQRSTRYTVEAIGLPATATREFTWVGVNQVMVNRYVEAAITHGLLPELFPPHEVRTVEREVRLGVSRLDLRVNGNAYVEVKMPVAHIQLDMPPDIPRRELKLSTVDRMLRQVNDIEGALRAGDRAILLVAFCYDNPGFRIPESDGTARTRFVGVLGAAAKHGLERWQVNFRVHEDHVAVAGHWAMPA